MSTDWRKLLVQQIAEEVEKVLAAAPSNEPLLICIDCKNTESPAGAMARHFNRGKCLHCGGFFKVVRA